MGQPRARLGRQHQKSSSPKRGHRGRQSSAQRSRAVPGQREDPGRRGQPTTPAVTTSVPLQAMPPRRGGGAPQSTQPSLPRPLPRVAALLVVSILRSSPRPLAWKGTPALLLSCWAVSVAGRQGPCQRSRGLWAHRTEWQGLEESLGLLPGRGASARWGGPEAPDQRGPWTLSRGAMVVVLYLTL